MFFLLFSGMYRFLIMDLLTNGGDNHNYNHQVNPATFQVCQFLPPAAVLIMIVSWLTQFFLFLVGKSK